MKIAKTRKHKNQLFKLGDFLAIFILIILSFIPAYFFLQKQTHKANENFTYARIRVNNHLVKTIRLGENKHFTWTYHSHGEKNIVEVNNDKIRVKDANCKDQVCVKQGWKSRSGQSIVCLPHKFLIEIKSDKPHTENDTNKKDFDNTLVNP
ncbi:NusG domain II-containing protein [uncultured Lactobacillus sp.]|uniref:NusG domain II-containing protein n=1 Tax=uncultured Lactobacillus sp. TaxID=153152 RepID=UPI00263628F3|nr:NusG domain II-containing protein [uncultured Lactobacillus sp.]